MLSRIAQEDLKALRLSGFSPTDAEVVQLNDLAMLVERAKDNNITSHPRKYNVGNVVLHELTVGAIEWWEEYGKEAFTSDDDRVMGYFFTFAHARELEYLGTLTEEKEIRKALKKWKKGLEATPDQLWKGMMWCKFGDETPELKKQVDDCVEVLTKSHTILDYIWTQVIQVSSASGISPDELRTRTQDELTSLLCQSLYFRSGAELKRPFADAYIAYKQLLKKIEDRGTDENGGLQTETIDNHSA